MFILIRFLILALFLWALMQFIGVIIAATSNTRVCPRCDGNGFWYNTRERVRCDQCKGSGKLVKTR